MKNIKYRVWFNSITAEVPHFKWVYREIDHSPYDLYMSTGEKDNNGKEIYEGDIVECSGDSDQVGQVIYCNYDRRFIILHTSGARIDLEDCLVVGNIYEDSKLLENK